MAIRKRTAVVVPQLELRPPPKPKMTSPQPIPHGQDDRDLLIKIRALAHTDNGGLSINVFPTARGFQGNVSVKCDKGWATSLASNPLAAIEQAVDSKLRVLKNCLGAKGPRC